MKTTHLTPNDYKTTAWSGGSTTELYLAPENGSYADRHFLIRISSATVEESPSEFTALPGITRMLVPLTNTLTLTHEDAPPVTLKPGEPHIFSGAVKTISEGTGTDFNIMTTGSLAPHAAWHNLKESELYSVLPEYNSYTFFFIVSGDIKIKAAGNAPETYHPGDLMVCEPQILSPAEEITLTSATAASYLAVNINNRL